MDQRKMRARVGQRGWECLTTLTTLIQTQSLGEPKVGNKGVSFSLPNSIDKLQETSINSSRWTTKTSQLQRIKSQVKEVDLCNKRWVTLALLFLPLWEIVSSVPGALSVSLTLHLIPFDVLSSVPWSNSDGNRRRRWVRSEAMFGAQG